MTRHMFHNDDDDDDEDDDGDLLMSTFKKVKKNFNYMKYFLRLVNNKEDLTVVKSHYHYQPAFKVFFCVF